MTDAQAPARVIGLANVLEVGLGGLSSCALKTDHTAFCWGSNAFGEAGDMPFALTPETVVGF
jgi:alpha-tubulin suppressor-like RCC1 family protein